MNRIVRKLVLVISFGALAVDLPRATAAQTLDPTAWSALLSFRPPLQVQQDLYTRAESAGQWHIQPIEDAYGDVNLDYYPVFVRRMPQAADGSTMTPAQLLADVRVHLAQFIDHNYADLVPYGTTDDARWKSTSPLGAVMTFKVHFPGLPIPVWNPDDGSVVTSEVTPTHWIFSPTWTSNAHGHPVSGNREFGVIDNGDGTSVLYLRGADRTTGSLDFATNKVFWQFMFTSADHLWSSFAQQVAQYIVAHGGDAIVQTRTSQRLPWAPVAAAYVHAAVPWLDRTYSVEDLGTLGGSTSRAFGINNRSEVVGESTLGDGNLHAFIDTSDSNGVWIMRDLGTLPGLESSARAINTAGQVVGVAVGSVPGQLGQIPVSYALLWSRGSLKKLGDPYTGAYGINDASVIAGTGTSPRDGISPAGFVWADVNGNDIVDAGELMWLPTLGGTDGKAAAINSKGTVVGDSFVSNSPLQDHAFMWDSGAIRDLGAIAGGRLSIAQGVNAGRQVVGYSATTGLSRIHAILWDLTKKVDLGTLGGDISSAWAINDASQIVGYADTIPGAVSRHAFVCRNVAQSQPSGTLVLEDLNALLNGISGSPNGWTLETATAINGPGQIVGYGTKDGAVHAFRLTPVRYH